MDSRLALCLPLILTLPACDVEATLQSLFSRPTRYVVERGDTLGEIAAAHGVTVADLRSWNGIEGDLIEVDQVLLIYPDDRGLVATSRGNPSPTPRGRRRGTVTVAPGAPATADEPARLAIRIDGQAGILGAEGPSGDASGIRAAAEGIGRRDGAAPTGSGLDARGEGLGAAGTAEGLDVDPVAHAPTRPSAHPGTPTLDPGLRMPAAKPCLEGPTDVAGDRGIAVSQGLEPDQLRAGLEAVTGHALSCFEGASGRFDVGLSLVVGCDGRVSEVTVTDPGGLPPATLSCVSRTLQHAGFPAHARPDGVPIALPLQFEF